MFEGKIIHLLTPKDWEEAMRRGSYKPASLKTEGFIHFSTPEQTLGSAELYYAQEDELVALIVVKKWVKDHLKWEPGRDDEDFPHLYSSLKMEHVETTTMLIRGKDGKFAWE